MSPRNTQELIQKLKEITLRNRDAAGRMAQLDPETLHQRQRPDAWNAIECFAHLNYYSDFYVPEIRRRIDAAVHPGQTTFTSSWLGNKFAAGMKPSPTMRKISTPRGANPKSFTEAPTEAAISTFIAYQGELLELLEQARAVDLTKTKTGISIMPLLKIRLGDTLRVVIYHNWRHVLQAQRACGLAGE